MQTLSDRLADRDSDIVQDALTRRCVLCDALPNVDYTNMPIAPTPLTGRIVHLARTAP